MPARSRSLARSLSIRAGQPARKTRNVNTRGMPCRRGCGQDNVRVKSLLVREADDACPAEKAASADGPDIPENESKDFVKSALTPCVAQSINKCHQAAPSS